MHLKSAIPGHKLGKRRRISVQPMKANCKNFQHILSWNLELKLCCTEPKFMQMIPITSGMCYDDDDEASMRLSLQAKSITLTCQNRLHNYFRLMRFSIWKSPEEVAMNFSYEWDQDTKHDAHVDIVWVVTHVATWVTRWISRKSVKLV